MVHTIRGSELLDRYRGLKTRMHEAARELSDPEELCHISENGFSTSFALRGKGDVAVRQEGVTVVLRPLKVEAGTVEGGSYISEDSPVRDGDFIRLDLEGPGSDADGEPNVLYFEEGPAEKLLNQDGWYMAGILGVPERVVRFTEGIHSDSGPISYHPLGGGTINAETGQVLNVWHVWPEESNTGEGSAVLIEP